MAKAREPVITVSTVFAGGQTDRQAFIDLIIQKKEIVKSQVSLDIAERIGYNEITPNFVIHSRTEVISED